MERASPFILVVTFFGQAYSAAAQGKTDDLPAGIRLQHAITIPKGSPGRVVVFADHGRELVTSTADGMHAWDLTTGKRSHTWRGRFQAFTVSADSLVIAAMDEKNEVHIFDASTRKRKWQFRFSGVKPETGAWPNDTAVLSFSPNGKRMAVGCFLDVEIWNLDARKLLHRFERQTGIRFGILEFFPDSTRLIVAGYPTYDTDIWNTALQKWDGEVYLYKYARCAKLSPDGMTFAAGIHLFGPRGSLYLIPTSHRKWERRFVPPSPVNSIAFSPDGRIVAARCRDEKVLLIHVKSTQLVDALAVEKIDYKSPPLGLSFSPDGELLAADNGSEILVWNLKQWRKKLRQYEHLSPERLEAVWQDLARWLSDDDDWTDVPPVHQLLGVPEQAVPLLRQKVTPVPLPDPDTVNRLICELDHAEFAVRDRATKALHRLDWLAKPFLNEALKKTKMLETKRRIQRLLDNMPTEWSAEHMRQYRAVEILDVIGTDASRHILRELAMGAPAAYLTQLAQERIQRLSKVENAK